VSLLLVREETKLSNQTRLLNYWSLAFGLLGTFFLSKYGLSFASSHTFIIMILIRQISIVFEKDEMTNRIQELEERLNAFDPYAPEIEPE